MNDISRQYGIADDPTQAFESLRQEISLLHTAIQGLTAAREKIPDYSPTLGAISRQLAAVTEGIARIEQAPAVKLTPSMMVQQLAKAAADARADDKRQMDDARADLHKVIGRMDGLVVRARSTDLQRKRELRMMLGAFLFGILLWSFLPGVVARSLPGSWHVPQWMAARTLGTEHATRDNRVADNDHIPEKN
ncbi:DUF6118 family protein [uncultured Sphingomonas sp.]|uniref:DUF6118 family protein n=1 Tax=uncultured Sphingomonas sp. TaxID=158754 RepID=UPI0025D64858|nr:DUF6118 family protein [uncultured Sphingomonas sp.]